MTDEDLPDAPRPSQPSPRIPPPHTRNNVLWVLGGCGVILAVLALTTWLMFAWMFRKVRDIGENPERFIAEMIEAHPEAEVVTLDREAHRVRLRNRTTGQEVTLSFADIARGRLVWTGPAGEQVTIDADGVRIREADSDPDGNADPPAEPGSDPPP